MDIIYNGYYIYIDDGYYVYINNEYNIMDIIHNVV